MNWFMLMESMRTKSPRPVVVCSAIMVNVEVGLNYKYWKFSCFNLCKGHVTCFNHISIRYEYLVLLLDTNVLATVTNRCSPTGGRVLTEINSYTYSLESPHSELLLWSPQQVPPPPSTSLLIIANQTFSLTPDYIYIH